MGLIFEEVVADIVVEEVSCFLVFFSRFYIENMNLVVFMDVGWRCVWIGT